MTTPTDSGNQGNNAGSPGEPGNETTKVTGGVTASSEGNAGSQSDDTIDESALDEKTKNYLKKMRAENAKHRTCANKLETEFESVKARLKG